MKSLIVCVICAIIISIGHIEANIFSMLKGEKSIDYNNIFPSIASKYGYPTEVKEVVTEDGYILTMYHISGDKTKAVLLIHGNTPTADCWIIREDVSLAITLARKGYDVWAINLRGTRYSRRHQYLNPNTQPDRFFNYSFYEQGVYDLPATIDFILNETGQDKLVAIGHSVGTTHLYTMGSEKPEYNDKIKVGISLAPISFLEHLRGLASIAALLPAPAEAILDLLNINELLGYAQIGPLLKAFCLLPFGHVICIELAFFSAIGSDPKSFEKEFDLPFFEHYPGGTTKKIIKHLLQLIQNKEFTKYDYGSEKNLIAYNSKEPPKFDLSKVTMKSALFVGQEDFLATVEDSKRLNASLPNVVHYQVMPYETFNHGDFIWDRYMPDHLYPYLLPVIEKYI